MNNNSHEKYVGTWMEIFVVELSSTDVLANLIQ